MIRKDTVVAISYSMSDEQGRPLENNDGFAPIVYLQGAGNIISELESGLNGLKAGDTREIVVAKTVTNLLHTMSESSPSQEDSIKFESLCFNVKIISVRDATPAEIAAGFPLPESSCDCKPGCC